MQLEIGEDTEDIISGENLEEAADIKHKQQQWSRWEYGMLNAMAW